jgi:hypothetical protein
MTRTLPAALLGLLALSACAAPPAPDAAFHAQDSAIMRLTDSCIAGDQAACQEALALRGANAVASSAYVQAGGGQPNL